MIIKQKLFLINRSTITYLELRNKNWCNVCGKEFVYNDRVIRGGGKNAKHYHEDCYGRLLH